MKRGSNDWRGGAFRAVVMVLGVLAVAAIAYSPTGPVAAQDPPPGPPTPLTVETFEAVATAAQAACDAAVGLHGQTFTVDSRAIVGPPTDPINAVPVAINERLAGSYNVVEVSEVQPVDPDPAIPLVGLGPNLWVAGTSDDPADPDDNGGRDLIIGTPGKDTIYADGGADIVCGNGGNDLLYGYGFGGGEAQGEDGGDVIVGGDGIDIIIGDSGPDVLAADIEDFQLPYPGAGPDPTESGNTGSPTWGYRSSNFPADGDDTCWPYNELRTERCQSPADEPAVYGFGGDTLALPPVFAAASEAPITSFLGTRDGFDARVGNALLACDRLLGPDPADPAADGLWFDGFLFEVNGIPRLVRQVGLQPSTADFNGPGLVGVDGSPDGSQLIIGTDDPQIIAGRSGADVICGLGGDDQLNGFAQGSGDVGESPFFPDGPTGLLAADDILIGGPGIDLMNGDRGSDLILGDVIDYDAPLPDVAIRGQIVPHLPVEPTDDLMRTEFDWCDVTGGPAQPELMNLCQLPGSPIFPRPADITLPASIEAGNVIGSLVAEDPDGDPVEYDITGLGLLTVDPGTGDVIVVDPVALAAIDPAGQEFLVSAADGPSGDPDTLTTDESLTVVPAATTDTSSVSVDNEGEWAAVGVPSADTVYIMRRLGGAGGTWTTIDTLTGTGGSEFGADVSIGGSVLLVGAPGAAGGTGQVHGFVRQPGGTYDPAPAEVLVGSQAGPGDRFGASVGQGENGIIVVGAPGDDTNGADAGAVYLGTFTVSSSPTETQYLTIDGTGAGDQVGFSVSTNGHNSSVAYAGAPGTAADRGTVFRLQRTDLATPGSPFEVVATVTASDGVTGDRLGEAIDSDSNVVTTGAPGADGGAGRAYVFRTQGNDTWTEETLPPPQPLSPGDRFGGAVGGSGDVSAVAATGAGFTAVYFRQRHRGLRPDRHDRSGAGGVAVGRRQPAVHRVRAGRSPDRGARRGFRFHVRLRPGAGQAPGRTGSQR